MENYEGVEEEPSSASIACRRLGNRRLLIALACTTAVVALFSTHATASPAGDAVELDVRNGGGDFGSQDISRLPDATQISKQQYPGYPECADRLAWMLKNWNSTQVLKDAYTTAGVDGSVGSVLNFLNQHGLYCPTLGDASRVIIRGVSLGGWLVLEPWIKPSLFEQFDPSQEVNDQWTFCQVLGKAECQRQLNQHWDTWVSESDIATLAASGINHVRIPVGYWVMGDIRPEEPWVTGELRYLQRAMLWCKKYNIKVLFDLHCAPGSQNGFDNSGRKGDIHWADSALDQNGNIFYPNIERTIVVLEALVAMFSLDPFEGVVKYIELVNEAFVTIDIALVKSFYTRGYAAVRNINPDIGIVIGDSFRFMSWDDFMFPPDFNHVYIDTHIYQVFDAFRLSMSVQDHVDQSCKINLPQVAISPLSTLVGEWSGAMNDCAKWLNGAHTGARYDGSFPGSSFIGSCTGYDNVSSPVYTDEYKQDLQRFVESQMEAYESGSSQGWFFWNFKTEVAPQWNYLLGLEQGWIPKDPQARKFSCSQ